MKSQECVYACVCVSVCELTRVCLVYIYLEGWIDITEDKSFLDKNKKQSVEKSTLCWNQSAQALSEHQLAIRTRIHMQTPIYETTFAHTNTYMPLCVCLCGIFFRFFDESSAEMLFSSAPISLRFWKDEILYFVSFSVRYFGVGFPTTSFTHCHVLIFNLSMLNDFCSLD